MPAASPSSPTDLSEGEWAILGPLLPPAKPGGRPRTVDLRRVLHGSCYVLLRPAQRMSVAVAATRVRPLVDGVRLVAYV
jgi:hypothetical protein